MAAHSTGIQLTDLQQQVPARPTPPQRKTHPYYSTFPPSLREKFQDLDSDQSYSECEEAVLGHDTDNFIVDFGSAPEEGGAAWCALNIDNSEHTVEAVKQMLEKPNYAKLKRNIFSPHTQKPLVTAIAQYYGLSSRHTSVLTDPPPMEPAEYTRPTQPPQMMDRVKNSLHRNRDVENGTGDSLETASLTKREREGVKAKTGRKGHMDIVSSVWHWHAVEWGGRFMCIGFNLLHQLPPEPDDANQTESDNDTDYEDEWSGDEDGEAAMDKGENYPQGKRLWSWLVLCDDGTVLAFHEPAGRVTPRQMMIIRKNMSTIFRSLSRSQRAQEEVVGSSRPGTGLDELPFRRVQHIHPGGIKSDNVDSGPSLLFYYLFDDWHSSLDLVIGRGYPYSIHMSKLRQDLQRNPKLSHISRLHRLARQLATLKRMYETKKIIIDNVLYRQENSLLKPGPSKGGAPQSPPSLPGVSPGPLPSDPSPLLGDPDILGVPLSPLAVAKFERLRDRIKLYALGEIDDCLAEKSELVSMTFNLIAMRESQAVERLSRVAIFLTKFTFLFLPLTLITGYFSMQLVDTQGLYKLKHFWGASGVFVAIMIIILYTVGRSTDTMESGIMWKSMKTLWFPCLTKKKKKKKGKGRDKKGHVNRGSWRRV